MKGRAFVAYAIVTAVLEQVGVAAVALWLLPGLGIQVPIWALLPIMIGLGVYSYVVTVLNKKALDKRPLSLPDIGSKGKVATLLSPTGYVRIGNELWQASSTGPTIGSKKEIVVTAIEGMTLLVAPADGSNSQPSDRA